MKILIERNNQNIETSVHVYCSDQPDSQTRELLNTLHSLSVTLSGIRDNQQFRLRTKDIYYIECVDDKTFLYTVQSTFESPNKLYQLEELLQDTSFVRISKSVLLNTDLLESVRPLLNAKIEASLTNGEKLLINRHYVSEFRKKFGV